MIQLPGNVAMLSGIQREPKAVVYSAPALFTSAFTPA